MKKLYIITLLWAFSGLSTIANAQAPAWQWAKSAGGASGSTNGQSISTDASGNVFVTGDFNVASITFGTTTLTRAGGADIFVVKYDASGNVLWAKSAGGTSSDYADGISTDASGNVLVTGSFASASITFGTTTLTNTLSNFPDIFVVKYDASGNVLWAKSAGNTSSEKAYGISTDTSGNVLVTGIFWSATITFGTTTLTPVGGGDIFVVKYDASGNVLWAKSAGGTSNDYAYGISTDASGNVLVTGNFLSDSITFGTTTLTNVGLSDIFVVKYDTSGNVLWAKSPGGTANDYGKSISTDASGNVLVTGDFVSASVTFGTTTLTNAGLSDIFVVKYDTSGNVLWAKSAGGTSSDYANGISTDASSNVLVTGYYISTSVTFGTTTLTNVGLSDIFVVKYDASGNALWAKSAGGTDGEYALGIATDDNGSVMVTGSFGLSVTFGTTTLTSVNSSDVFVAKLDSTFTTDIMENSNSLNAVNIFPNPFSNSTTISFSLPQSEKISIKIFDVTGRLVKTLADGLFHEGENKIEWNATDGKRNAVNAGIYFLRFEVGNYSDTKKIIVAKQ